MGKKIILIGIFISFTIVNLHSQDIKKSKELEDIVTTFLSNYKVPQTLSMHLGFSRRANILYVARKKDFYDIQIEEPFYDFKTNEFLAITIFPKINEASDFVLPENISVELKQTLSVEVAEYKKYTSIFKDSDIFPIYGYKGFYNDVIKLYEGNDQLDLSQQFALCKAHSYKVVNLLYDNSYGLPSERINLDLDETLSNEQLTHYLKELKKEKRAYLTLKNKFPSFKYSSGSATEKYGHIVMHSFIHLLYCSNIKSASQVLEDNLFPDTIINAAKKVLNSCPKNSILYTWGDQDTYPLYYLQAHHKFRQDVIIINLSLTALPKYIQMVYKSPFNAPPILSSIPKKVFKQEIEVFLHSGSIHDDTTYTMNEYFNYIERNNFIESSFGSNYIMIPVSKLNIFLPKDCNQKSIELEIPNYFLMSELSQLDIINSNKWERTICYTKECLKSSNFLFRNLLLEKDNILELNLEKICK